MKRQGSTVQWKWGKGTATGEVRDVFDRSVTITTKGARVTRNGTPENKALFIVQENGTELLKLESEVEQVH
ncbi:hypothetical protein BH23BAC2_BH23BAC2_26310 [soil metagenome]